MKITIDTDHFAYLWRRFVHALRLFPTKTGRCSGCGVQLSAVERHYYEVHCERCAPMFMWDGE